jgi:hypothetical protein
MTGVCSLNRQMIAIDIQAVSIAVRFSAQMDAQNHPEIR